ncbi:MAG: Crp/Fnr family transcriptional regulator, partial [Bacteroidota bacterium]
HAATDTYRNGSWPFYNDLVGAIVQSGPNHTSANHMNFMDQIEPDHPTLVGIPDPWEKREEY